MAGSTYTLTIKSLTRNTQNAVTFGFEIPTSLRSEFDYEPGQYLTLELEIDGKKVRRAYSMNSSPLMDPYPLITVKRLKGGLVSNYINDNCKVGDSMEVLAPFGTFVPQMSSSNKKHYLLFAAGSGITPVISILKSILNFESNSKVSLLYGNRNAENILFNNELSQLNHEYDGRFVLKHTLSDPQGTWNGLMGRIDKIKVNSFIDGFAADDLAKEIFVCGPGEMIDTVISTLKERGFQSDQIHKELFFIEEKEQSAEIQQVIAESGKQQIKVILDQKEHLVEVNPNESILDAVLDANVDAPFSCMSGACATCRAKVISGKVIMDDDEVLSEKEISEGYVLTCQAHPVEGEICLNYDV